MVSEKQIQERDTSILAHGDLNLIFIFECVRRGAFRYQGLTFIRWTILKCFYYNNNAVYSCHYHNALIAINMELKRKNLKMGNCWKEMDASNILLIAKKSKVESWYTSSR
jgi:hypothetical protein